MNTVRSEPGSVKNEKLFIPSSKYPMANAIMKLDIRINAVTSLLLIESFNECMTNNLMESEFTHSFLIRIKEFLCDRSVHPQCSTWI